MNYRFAPPAPGARTAPKLPVENVAVGCSACQTRLMAPRVAVFNGMPIECPACGTTMRFGKPLAPEPKTPVVSKPAQANGSAPRPALTAELAPEQTSPELVWALIGATIALAVVVASLLIFASRSPLNGQPGSATAPGISSPAGIPQVVEQEFKRLNGQVEQLSVEVKRLQQELQKVRPAREA